MIDVQAHQLAISKSSDKKWQRILLFPLSRIVIAILFLMPVILLNNVFSPVISENTEAHSQIFWLSFKTLLFILLLGLSYRLYTRYVEKRVAFEFKLRNWYKDFGIGVLIGGGMVVLITGILFLVGSYEIQGTNSPMILVSRFFRYAQGAFIEELVFTIIVFRLVEELLGTKFSYILISVLFGALHLMNDNATIWTSLFISIQQITLLAPFILTRKIWMGWAVHFSWNFAQAGIFGMNNSGMNHDGFISPIISGPEWLTGGSFGIEGSWLSLIINVIVGIPILVYAVRSKQIVGFKTRRS